MIADVTDRGGPLRPGDPARLGPYTLLGRLGSGGMGVVFLARDRAGHLVAIKMVHADLASDEEFRRRFRCEVNRVRQVPPFCTAEVLDADPDAPRPYLVVEFVDGPSLADVVEQRGPLTPANLHAVAIGVATALTAIHDAGIIHRDLKPRNVLLAPGSPKVIDFGIARALESTSQHTRTGQLVGTVAYMAPERFSAEPGVPLTPAADVFAWGCVVAYAGTGRAPFSGDSPAATAARILTQPPDLAGLGKALRSLVELTLATDPRERPTARDLLELLLGSGPQRSPQLLEALARQPALRSAAAGVQAAAGTGAHPLPPRRPAAPEGRPADDDVTEPRRPHGVPRRPSHARRGRTGRVLLGVLAAVGALVLLAAAGIAVAGFSGAFVDPPTRPPVTPAQTRSGPAAFTLSAGEPFIVDPLDTGGQFSDSELGGEAGSNCRITGGAMRAQRVTPGVYHCEGPDKELTGDHTVAVTATIEQPGSCPGIWFHWADESSYRLTACPDRFQVAVEQTEAETYVVRDIPLDRPLPVAEPIRLQLEVRDGVARFGHDGVLVGEATLPDDEMDHGRTYLGLVNEPGDDTPPYAVSFVDVEIRTLAG